MKSVATFLALTFLGTAALGQSVDMSSLTPMLTFPDTGSGDESVTRNVTSNGN